MRGTASLLPQPKILSFLLGLFQRGEEPGGLCLRRATHRLAYKTHLELDAKSSFLLKRDSLSFRGKNKKKNTSVLLCKLKTLLKKQASHDQCLPFPDVGSGTRDRGQAGGGGAAS